MMDQSQKKRLGFTIIEILVVIVVIGIIAAVTIVSYRGVQSGAKDKVVISDVEGIVSEISRYSVKNSGTFGSAVAWYSGGSVNANINFAPSDGNVIDVVSNTNLYCVRAYNTAAATYNTLATAYSKSNNDDACTILSASVAAGGTGDASLIGWWKLNGDAMDSSGNGNNGSVVGAVPALGATSIANTAYLFSSSTTAQNILAPVQVGTGPLTYSAWVRPTAYPSDKATIIQNTGPLANYMSLNSSATLASYRYNTTPEGYHFSGSTTLPLNQWRFVTVNWDGINARLYIDGVVVNTIAVTGVGRASTGVIIGAEFVSRQFIGSIDDVRIYNRALSGPEILSLYTAGAR